MRCRRKEDRVAFENRALGSEKMYTPCIMATAWIPIDVVLKELKKLYKPPKSFLEHWKTPFQLLVATILSAQCTDDRVNKVTPALFKRFPNPKAFAQAKREDVQRMIFSCGHYNNKSTFIQGMSRLLLTQHGGKVPQTMEELVELPGVGRKTAAIILHAAFGKEEGIAVDTHVLRLAQRLGLTKQKLQGKIELDLMRMTPKKDWGNVNPLLISHGRAVCTALRRKCEQCVFQKRCPSSLVLGKRDLAKNGQ